MKGAVNTNSCFRVFQVESTWQILSEPHMNNVLWRQQEILLSAYAPCWESHQWFPHTAKTPAIPFFPFIHLVSCLDTCCVGSNSPHCQHPVLSSTSIPEATAVIHTYILALTLCSCHSLVQTHWLMHSFSSGTDTTLSLMPITLAEMFNSAAFCALLNKKTPQFQVSIFQMLSMKDSFIRLLSASGFPHLKRPLYHTACEACELHHRWDFGVKPYHPLN